MNCKKQLSLPATWQIQELFSKYTPTILQPWHNVPWDWTVTSSHAWKYDVCCCQKSSTQNSTRNNTKAQNTHMWAETRQLLFCSQITVLWWHNECVRGLSNNAETSIEEDNFPTQSRTCSTCHGTLVKVECLTWNTNDWHQCYKSTWSTACLNQSGIFTKQQNTCKLF